MHFSDIIVKLGSNLIWRYFCFFHWQKFCLQPVATLLNFFLQICKLCKSGLISRSTNIVYIGRYLVLTYIKWFISTVFSFFSYICWSVNCMSWVCKFYKFFLTWTETETRFIFEGFNIVLHGKFSSDTPIFFFLLFWFCLQIVEETFSVSKLY